MKNQMIFKRNEIKYLLNKQQKAAILNAMEPYMALDEFGHIANGDFNISSEDDGMNAGYYLLKWAAIWLIHNKTAIDNKDKIQEEIQHEI